LVRPRTAKNHGLRESGQAAIEAALTLPLLTFLVLGSLQLFLMIQARQMAQYAAFWAAREGSVTQANCVDMKAVTLKALLPTFTVLRDVAAIRDAARRMKASGYRYDPLRQPGFSGDVFWLLRDRPLVADVDRAEVERFDQGRAPMRLEVRLVYWFPLRIPFANWVMVSLVRAAYGLENYSRINPLMPAAGNAKWTDQGKRFDDAAVREAFDQRTEAGERVFPIIVSSSMRMLTPAVVENFRTQHCLQ
jgi:hypothetical protein